MMVVTTAPCPVKYINIVFARVDAVTNGRCKQEAKIKEVKLVEIEKIYKYHFRNGINTETPECLKFISILRCVSVSEISRGRHDL